MTKYAKNEAGDLVGDDGSTLRRTEHLTIDLTLTDVVRTSVVNAGDIFPLAGAGKNINAVAEVGNNTAHLLHDGDLKPWTQQITIHIGVGNDGGLFKEEVGIGWAITPNLDEGSSYHDRQLMLSVRLPQPEFERLWDDLGKFREPGLRVSLRLVAWQRDIDAHFGPEVGWSRFVLLASDSRSVWSNYSPILGVNFYLDDKQNPRTRSPTTDFDQGAPNLGPTRGPLGPSSLSLETLPLLRWIIGLLVILILATIFW